MSLSDPNSSRPSAKKRVALVIANPTTSTTTGWPGGFWWSELTHPYYAFHEVGYEVDLFSPDGGACVADAMSDPRDPSGYSATDLISMGFIHTPRLASLVEVSEYEPDRVFALRMIEGSLPIDARISLEPANGGTKMSFTAHGRLEGPMRLLQPVLARILKKQFAANTATLARSVASRRRMRPGAAGAGEVVIGRSFVAGCT